MKKIHKIIKISAKESFSILRKKSPYTSKELSENIFISRVFWDHLNFAKDRDLKESIMRLSFFSLIPKILKNGKITEKRDNFTKISLKIESVRFSLIIIKNSYRNTLLSCFVEY